MPAFGGFLTDKEIWAALSFIKGHWPKAIQKKHDRISKKNAPEILNRAGRDDLNFYGTVAEFFIRHFLRRRFRAALFRDGHQLHREMSLVAQSSAQGRVVLLLHIL